ncbi:type II toxin-antitoxin system RelE family toxin [Tenacibaculum piscium]|uniref:Putative toxin RelE2 n=1 Tax=Tenacibaculum piscium TaxID=1458515 RepID=A0A2H1YKE2_9FLAO|nr:type II toxin-antitoxin system RelE/ParE family toxin [Tenacibaculum piscium]MBE7629225.1 type II toxin-antitoxin system RelE/ParE family toxin [Tenacibaculum piscium]MBE7670012.1 type II toxin-antitoxin system RelE/ParE family toxin [Tenacibaculum piscium]MBE7685563.1 type II toxin-antitoxin system RelE/ParE family toxin [Tenacibaculum piscium]MBE7690147.1 type II toxin-antitoxin system RelE/ParE family toxin [Tenacibaculum piscium]SOS75984.1 putative toxin RelE2 [Tenacibaculum piscium]
MNVIYLESLKKDLKKIKDKKLLKNLSEVFIKLEDVDDLLKISSVKKLSGHPDAYRIRIGDYRLGIYYNENEISIVRFVKRNDIYKIFP